MSNRVLTEKDAAPIVGLAVLDRTAVQDDYPHVVVKATASVRCKISIADDHFIERQISH